MSSDDVMLAFSCLHRISFSRFYNSWCRLCHMNSSYWRFLFHHYLSHDCLKTEYFIWYSMAGLGNQMSASSLWVCCFCLCGWGLLWINSIKHVFSVMYGPWSASGFALWPVELTETFLMPGLGESLCSRVSAFVLGSPPAIWSGPSLLSSPSLLPVCAGSKVHPEWDSRAFWLFSKLEWTIHVTLKTFGDMLVLSKSPWTYLLLSFSLVNDLKSSSFCL